MLYTDYKIFMRTRLNKAYCWWYTRYHLAEGHRDTPGTHGLLEVGQEDVFCVYESGRYVLTVSSAHSFSALIFSVLNV